MIQKFTMTVFASGHTVAELEAHALNRAAALTGWRGPIRIHASYKINEIPAIAADYTEGAWSSQIEAARQRGDTLWSDVSVVGYDPSGIDLNPVLEEGLRAILDWEQATTCDATASAGLEMSECLATIHDVLSNGGKLPDAWKDAV